MNPQIIQDAALTSVGRRNNPQNILQRVLDTIFSRDLWFLSINNNPDSTLIFRELPGRPRLGQTSQRMASMQTEGMRHPFRTLSDLPANAIPLF